MARGLVVIEERGTGRGRASTVTLPFADSGPWWDGELNVELCEAVLGYSSARGPARLLLAAMAAVADADGVVRDFSTEQLCAAAGVADRTYRRARRSLLESGQLVLVSGAGGRGNTNVWTVPDPRSAEAAGARIVRRRVAPPNRARPIVAVVGRPDAVLAVLAGVDPASTAPLNGGHDRTVDSAKCPNLTGVSALKDRHHRTVPAQNRPALTGVSAPKGGQAQTLFPLPLTETPAERAAETPAAHARAGREPQNPRIEDPPNPLQGGARPTR